MNPFAPPGDPAPDPFAPAPPGGPPSDPFASGPPGGPPPDPFASGPPGDPAPDPFAPAPPGGPPFDPFASGPPGGPPPDPFASDPLPPELMNGPLPDDRDDRSSSFLLPDVSGAFVPPPPVPASFDANGPDLASDPHDTYAIEMRAESIDMLSLGNATRRGELDRVEVGDGEGVDSVAGEETAKVGGELREHTGHGLTQTAARLETTVNGRLSLTCGGEDTILLGGAMTDTWTGGAFIAAAMSDDLAVGAGVRVTAPADMWLNALAGMEERPGTAVADGVYIDLCGTLFEREYGPGMHAAGIAQLSGNIYQTQKTGFRPLMKVSMGVRNLLPGAGGAAAEPPPPAPPPAAPADQRPFEPWYLAKGLKRRRAQITKLDSVTNMIHVANTAQDMENAADLRHLDAADNLEELRTAAGQGEGYEDLEELRRLDTVDQGAPEPVYHTLEGPAPTDQPAYHTLEGPAPTDQPAYHTLEGPEIGTGEELYARGDTYGVENEVLYDVFRPQFDHKEVKPVDMRRNPRFKPQKLDFVTDGRGIVVVGADTYEQLEQGLVVLRVHDSSGRRLSPQSYTIAVAGYEVAPSGDLYRTIDLSRRLPAVGDDPTYARLGDLGDVGRTDSLDDYSADDLGEPLYARLGGTGEDGAPPLPPRLEGHPGAGPGPGGFPGAGGDDLPPPVSLSSHPSRDPLPARVRFEQDGSFDGPIGAKPDDFDWEATDKALLDRYLEYRRATNWRGTLAYTEAINELRQDLLRQFTEFGGDLTRLAPEPGTVPKAADTRKAITELLEQAVEADDLAQMQRIGQFLEEHDQKTYETFAELLNRADEFAGTRTGSQKGLDPHIDQQKLLDWMEGRQRDLEQRAMDAMDANEFDAAQEYHNGLALFHQLHRTLSEGGDPLQDASQQIAYLRAVDGHKQADVYLKHQADLMEVLSDPTYHRTAAEMGDATYSPLDFTRFQFDPGESIHEGPRPASFVDDPDGASVPDFLHSAEADLPAGRAIQPLEPEGDVGRHMLDVMPEQVAIRQDAGGVRLQFDPPYERHELPPAELSPPSPSQIDAGPGGTPSSAYENIGFDPAAYENVPLDPTVRQSPPSPQLDVDGGVARWTTNEGSELDIATGRRSRGDYADSVADGTSVGEDSGHVVSADTQAVIDAMPDRRSGDSYDSSREDLLALDDVVSPDSPSRRGILDPDLSDPVVNDLTPYQREFVENIRKFRADNPRNFDDGFLVVTRNESGRYVLLNGLVIADNQKEFHNFLSVVGEANVKHFSMSEMKKLYSSPDVPISYTSFGRAFSNPDNAHDPESGRLIVKVESYSRMDAGHVTSTVYYDYVTSTGDRIPVSSVSGREKAGMQVVPSYHNAFFGNELIPDSELTHPGDLYFTQADTADTPPSPNRAAWSNDPVGFHSAYGNSENLRVDGELVVTRIGDRYVTTGGDVVLVEDVHFWNRYRTVDADEFQTVIKTLEPPPEVPAGTGGITDDVVRHAVPSTDIWDALDADMHRFGDTEPLALEGKPDAFRPVIGPGDAADSPEVLLEQWRQLAATLEEPRIQDADFANMAAPGAEPSDFAHLHREATDAHRVQVTGQKQRYESAANALAFAHRMLANGEDPRPSLLASADEARSVAEAEFMRALADDVTRMLIRESNPGATADFVDAMAEFYRAKHAEGVDPEALAYADDLVALYRGESAPTTMADPVPDLHRLGGADPPALDESTGAPRLGDSGDALKTDVFGAEVEDPNGVSHGDGGVTAGAGDYGASRDAINAQVGPGDFARAPQQQPEGLGSEVNVLDTTDDQIDANILEAERNAARQEPGSTQRFIEETGRQRGDEAADLYMARHGRHQPAEGSDRHRMFRKAVERERSRARLAGEIEAANLKWADAPMTDQRPFDQWYLAKNLKRRRAQISKTVRFGAANLLSFRVEPESAGSKFRVAVDPVDTLDRSQAIRHVEAPSGWRPTRRPGFDRTALAPGEFPFSAKERILNTLMQGKALDAGTVDKLSDIFDEAATQRRIAPQSKEWRNMASLVGDLRQAERASGTEMRRLASAMDWKTLEKMLYMLDMSTMAA